MKDCLLHPNVLWTQESKYLDTSFQCDGGQHLIHSAGSSEKEYSLQKNNKLVKIGIVFKYLLKKSIFLIFIILMFLMSLFILVFKFYLFFSFKMHISLEYSSPSL